MHPYLEDEVFMIMHKSHPLAPRGRASFLDTLGYKHIGMQRLSAMGTIMQRIVAVGYLQLKAGGARRARGDIPLESLTRQGPSPGQDTPQDDDALTLRGHACVSAHLHGRASYNP